MLCLLAIPGSMARAEGLQLQLKLEHGVTLQYEPIVAFVTVVNDTAKPFVISEAGQESAASLEFVIRKESGEKEMARLRRDLLVEKVYISSDQKEEVMVEISNFYDLREEGRYLVSAKVTWDGKTYWSDRKMIDVVSGLELSSTSKSVPGYPDRIRTYSVRYWAREAKEYLFLRVEEEPSRLVYGVFQLGPLVRVFKPFVEVDRAGNVRTVHQVGNDCYIHTFFKSDRESVRFLDHTYRRANGDPYVEETPPPVKETPVKTPPVKETPPAKTKKK